MAEAHGLGLRLCGLGVNKPEDMVRMIDIGVSNSDRPDLLRQAAEGKRYATRWIARQPVTQSVSPSIQTLRQCSRG